MQLETQYSLQINQRLCYDGDNPEAGSMAADTEKMAKEEYPESLIK